VEPPAVLDRAAVRQGLAVQLGQVAVLQVALAERRVLQVPARLRVQRVLLQAPFSVGAPCRRGRVVLLVRCCAQLCNEVT
jgi:hypothetical protein